MIHYKFQICFYFKILTCSVFIDSDTMKREIHEERVKKSKSWKFPTIFPEESVNTAILEAQDQSLVLSKQTHDPLKSCCTGKNRGRLTAAYKLIHFVTYCAYYVWSTSHVTQKAGTWNSTVQQQIDVYEQFFLTEAFIFLLIVYLNGHNSSSWKNFGSIYLKLKKKN